VDKNSNSVETKMKMLTFGTKSTLGREPRIKNSTDKVWISVDRNKVDKIKEKFALFL
jgi:hypothetical protein